VLLATVCFTVCAPIVWVSVCCVALCCVRAAGSKGCCVLCCVFLSNCTATVWAAVVLLWAAV
jgi:hypothetical protein